MKTNPTLKKNRKQLLLHIGAHKTGSTALQLLLSENREEFESQGFLVPSSGRPNSKGHHQLAWALYRDKKLQRHWEELYEEAAASHASKLIVSSEEFDKAGEGDLVELTDLTKKFDTRVLLYVRRQVDCCEARYRTVVEHYGYTSDFFEFFENNMESFDWHRKIEMWTRAFSKDCLLVRLYDKNILVNESILDDFLSIVKLDKASFPNIPGSQTNHGLPFFAIEIIRLLSKSNTPKSRILEFRNWCYARLPKINYKYTILNSVEAEQVMSRYTKSNRMLRDAYFPERPDGLFENLSDGSRAVESDLQLHPELTRLVTNFFERRKLKAPNHVMDFLSQ